MNVPLYPHLLPNSVTPFTSASTCDVRTDGTLAARSISGTRRSFRPTVFGATGPATGRQPPNAVGGLAWRRVAVLRAVRPIYSAPVTRREGQRIGWLGVAVALLVIAIPVAEFAYFAIVGDEACSRGDSDFGVSSWSWIPPGPVCRYDGLEGTVETVGPSPFMSLYLVAALVFVWLLVVRRRRASSSLIHE